MNPYMHGLINGYLDNMLTEGQEAELNAWVKLGPENAAAFAGAIRLHDRLRDVIRAELMMAPAGNTLEKARPPAGSGHSRLWRRASVVGGLAALIAVALTVAWLTHPTAASAATELDRLINSSASTGDRTYVIRNLDSQPELPDERRPPIDGATLYVRRPSQYVLIRRFPDARQFITGSDGERSWAIPPDGAVRVSADPMRFRGPVPGSQHGIPFLDLRSDLIQLRDAYVVTLQKPQSNGWRGLMALKKSADYRGPRQVELWYDAATGVIHRMVFDGMPRARGGPNSVAVELSEQRDLGAAFFKHESHHGPDREVIEED